MAVNPQGSDDLSDADGGRVVASAALTRGGAGSLRTRRSWLRAIAPVAGAGVLITGVPRSEALAPPPIAPTDAVLAAALAGGGTVRAVATLSATASSAQ